MYHGNTIGGLRDWPLWRGGLLAEVWVACTEGTVEQRVV